MVEWTEIVIWTCFVEFGLCLFALARNEWVFRSRVRLLRKDLKSYMMLPSYTFMLENKFWIFDINKFIGMEEK